MRLEPDSTDRMEAFLNLLSEHEKRLAVYVTGLVASPQDAQDILQEGKIVMWRNFENFTLGTNFPAWGRKILFHQILAYRRKQKRRKTEWLDEQTLECLNEEMESVVREERWQKREALLQRCIQSLRSDHRQVLELRYRDEAGISEIAKKLGKTEGAVYRLLSRLRLSLHECVEMKMQGAQS